jgi:hypothetical protein
MRAASCILVLLVVFAAAGRAQDARSGRLHTAVYKAEALGHAAAGGAAWLVDDLGNLRLEIDRREGAPVVSVDALLDQRGTGWTLIAPTAGFGTANAWGEEWRRTPAGIAESVRLVAAALAAPPVDAETGRSAPSTSRPWRAGRGLARVARHAVGELVASEPPRRGGWRARQMSTAWGRGPSGEVLVLSWTPGTGGAAGALVARLSGRPGSVKLCKKDSYDVSYYDPEVFVPLWPLGEVLASRP